MDEWSRKPSGPLHGPTASTSRSGHGKPTNWRPTNSHGHEDDRYEGEREERALIHQIWAPPDDTSRPPHVPTGPIRTSNDVGRYPPEQQHPFSQHTMAPLGHHPQYSGAPPPVLQGVNSQSGNSSASSVAESYNKRRVTVGSGGNMQLGSNTSSSTILNIQAQALHVSVGHHPAGGGSFPQNHQLDAIASHPPATRPSVDYHGTSSHFTPPMRNPIASYEQPIDTRLRLPSNTELDYRNAAPPDQTQPPLRAKDVPALHPSRDREQEKPWGDSDERWSGSKAEDNSRRTRPSGHASNSTRNPPPPSRSEDSFPRGASFGGAPSPPERQSSQGGWVSTQDVEAFQRPKRVQEGPWPVVNVNQSWITSEDALPSHQKTPNAFPSVNQNLLPSASSDNSTRRIPVGSAPPPPVRQSSQGSSWHNINNRDVENVPWDRTQEQPRLETGGGGWFGPKDDGHSQRSPPSAYSSTSSGNPLSSLSSSDDSSRRVRPLGGAPPPPVRQTSQGGSWHNLKNPDVQALPRDKAIEEPRLEAGDRGWRPKDDGHSHWSPPGGHSSGSGNPMSSSSSNDSTRGLPCIGGRPPPPVRQSSQGGGGGAWHDIQNTQPLSRDRGQEENTDRRWIGHSRDGPSQQNPAGGYGNTSSRNPAPTARSTDKITQIPASVGPQPPPGPRQMAPEVWQNPYGTNSASSSSWLPESMPTGQIYPSPNHPPPGQTFRYQQELVATQQMMARTSIGQPTRKLTTIEESQIYNTATSHASYSSISTIPDIPKVQSIDRPKLVPFQRKKDIENWIHKKSSTDHIPLYMESKIIDDDTMPLWYPSPMLRSCDGTLRGVEVGDLGYLDQSGEFHCLFNIFQSFEANEAAGAIPPPRSYHRHLQVDPHPFIKQVDIQKRCVYLSDHIRRVDDSRSKTFYEFSIEKKSGGKAAIIVLPHGGLSSTLRVQFFQLPDVKQYFVEHAASWYQHAIAQHIPNISNGSLLFVHGTHRARTWGIAAFTSKNDVRESIHGRFSANSNNNRFEYQWDTPDNKWKTSAGPSAREFDALYGERPPMNQCIGVIISSLHLDDKTWKKYFASNDRSATSDRTASRGREFSITRMLTRMSSMSSIHVNQRPTGRRYADSLLENPEGVHYAADNYELLRREFV